MKSFFICVALLTACLPSSAQDNIVTNGNNTSIKVRLPETDAPINPMIYGQMLEDCNDNIIYGGIADKEGKENKVVTELLRPLSIPVMRWPGGSTMYYYEWKRGIGKNREPEKDHIWHGTEYYTFGTDEYIAWCRNLDIEPYINLAMGNNNTYDHSLAEALDWLEYGNGKEDSTYGSIRARNGHPEPYDVRLWCIGNENYLANVYHRGESADEYAAELSIWGKTIKDLYPEVELLAVGHDKEWNATVLKECNKYIDYITLHYYFNSMIEGKNLVNPQTALFNAALVEASIKDYLTVLEECNKVYARMDNPIRFSIDEWNNRHSVKYDGTYYSTRRDDRRLYDVCTTATMLNVFLRNSPYVAMSNYIFPVNGHGLVKTTGDGNAYKTTIYYVYELYRKYLRGRLAPVSIHGPGHKDVELGDYALIEGDISESTRTLRQDLCFVDAAASIDEDGIISIALVNRSYDKTQTISLDLPKGYKVFEIWSVESEDVTASNTAENPNVVGISMTESRKSTTSLLPCSLKVIRCKNCR